MSHNTKSGLKYSDQILYSHPQLNEDRHRSYRDDIKSLLQANRKSINLPSHNFNIYEIYKTKCTREVKLSEIIPIKNVILTNQLEISNISIMKSVRKGREKQLIIINKKKECEKIIQKEALKIIVFVIKISTYLNSRRTYQKDQL